STSCKRVGPRTGQADNNAGLRGKLTVWPWFADSMMARAKPAAKPNTRMQPHPSCRDGSRSVSRDEVENRSLPGWRPHGSPSPGLTGESIHKLLGVILFVSGLRLVWSRRCVRLEQAVREPVVPISCAFKDVTVLLACELPHVDGNCTRVDIQLPRNVRIEVSGIDLVRIDA